MTHDTYTDRLSEYLDGELAGHERTDVEAHVARCGTCRSVLTELHAVVRRAEALRDEATRPADDLWPGVADRISSRPGQAAPAPRLFSFTLPQLVAAGLALMVLSGSLVWFARLGGERTDFPAVTAVRETPAAQVREIAPANFATPQYDRAIADLQRTLDAHRSQLDADTVQVIETNLAAIDRAIEQARRALAEDPANAYLNSHLAEARMRKLGLLRRAAALADLGS